jgi:hypothetical protein
MPIATGCVARPPKRGTPGIRPWRYEASSTMPGLIATIAALASRNQNRALRATATTESRSRSLAISAARPITSEYAYSCETWRCAPNRAGAATVASQ